MKITFIHSIFQRVDCHTFVCGTKYEISIRYCVAVNNTESITSSNYFKFFCKRYASHFNYFIISSNYFKFLVNDIHRCFNYLKIFIETETTIHHC